MAKHLFLTLEGIDGAGKTTLAAAVCQRLSRSDLQFRSRRDFSGASDYVCKIASRLSEVLWASGDSLDLNSQFWADLQRAWHRLMSQSVLAQSACHVLMDGWFFKFVAKLAAAGVPLKQLLESFEGVRIPDHTFLLDITPATAWQRKIFGKMESGLHAQGETGLGRESFIRYQEATRQQLRAIGDQSPNWTLISVDGKDLSDCIECIVAEIESVINKHEH
jgi:thymidylate kinase